MHPSVRLAAAPRDVLVRRATQCSFSSAFHVDYASPAAKRAVDSVYTWLVAPALVVLGGAGLYRLDANGGRLRVGAPSTSG
jgi:hypothetical protein